MSTSSTFRNFTMSKSPTFRNFFDGLSLRSNGGDEFDSDWNAVFESTRRYVSISNHRSSASDDNSDEPLGRHIEEIETWIKQVQKITQVLSASTGNQNNILSKISFKDSVIPKDVIVTREFEKSVESISSIFLNMSLENEADEEQLVLSVATIPNLMKTIILIEDDDDRKRIMEYPIIKQVMMSKYSIIHKDEQDVFRSWISVLLQSQSEYLGEKVVHYLETISNFTAMDIICTQRHSRLSLEHTPLQIMNKFNHMREELFHSLARLTYFIPSLLLLKNRDLERVSTTDMVKSIIDWNLSRPFGTAIVFFDLFSQLMLLFTIRYRIFTNVKRGNTEEPTVTGFSNLFDDAWDEYPELQIEIWLLFLGLCSLLYLIHRRVADEITMFSISWEVYLIRFTNISNLIDLASLVLNIIGYLKILRVYMGTSTLDQGYFSTSAFNIGFMWLNLLGLLKIMNKNMAIFILGIRNIMKHIVWFIFVMIIIIFLFGDMLYIMVNTNDELCPDTIEENNTTSRHDSRYIDLFKELDEPNPYCQNRFTSYLAVYRVFIGDFSVENYEGVTGIVFIYILVTFFGIIILLNVLIALVIESYEESQRNAVTLFGTARIMYVARLLGCEIFVHPLRGQYAPKACILSMTIFTSTTVVTTLIIFGISGVIIADGLHNLGLTKAISIFISCMVALIPFLAMLSILAYFYTGWRKTGGIYKIRECVWLKKIQNNWVFVYLFALPISIMTRVLLGSISNRNDKYETEEQIRFISTALKGVKEEEKETSSEAVEKEVIAETVRAVVKEEMEKMKQELLKAMAKKDC